MIELRFKEIYTICLTLLYPLSRHLPVHLAVPDFGSGAMENWGLILYAEKSLLFDPHTGTAANKQRVAVVIAHELAHQVGPCSGSVEQ